MRVVWHYRALNEQRTFTIRYRFRGLAVAYDDVVDVNLQVWGDEWPVAVSDLRAEMELPRPIALTGTRYRVWGAPEWVRGVVDRTRTGTTLRAVNVPSGQFVEMRTVFPRRLLTSTRGARVVDGNGFAGDRRRAGGARGRVRRGPQEDRRGEGQPRPDDAHARRLRAAARAGRHASSSGSSSAASAAPATTASTSRSRPRTRRRRSCRRCCGRERSPARSSSPPRSSTSSGAATTSRSR